MDIVDNIDRSAIGEKCTENDLEKYMIENPKHDFTYDRYLCGKQDESCNYCYQHGKQYLCMKKQGWSDYK